MNCRSARALVCCSKEPLGPVGILLIDMYLFDTKDYTRGSLFAEALETAQPLDRCKASRRGGRCRGRVSRVAVTQLCFFHQMRVVGDTQIIAGMVCRREQQLLLAERKRRGGELPEYDEEALRLLNELNAADRPGVFRSLENWFA